MLKGLYEAAAGMSVRMAKQDVISNNLANASTSGFRREIAAVQVLPKSAGAANAPKGVAQPYVLNLFSRPDTRAGSMEQTGSSRNLALEGEGYLVTRTADGNRLIRGGEMQVDAQGRLTTAGGDPLLDRNGNPIRVGQGEFEVKPDGTVQRNERVLGRLRIVTAEGPLQREGDSLAAAVAMKDAPEGSVHVLQGVRESSNVQPVREMVDMIAGSRAYESAQKAFLAQDGTLTNLLTILQR